MTRAALQDWLGGFRNSWVVRSLGASAVGSAMDYATLVTCAWVLELPSAMCAFLGLSVGLSVSFTLNRWLAFRDSPAAVGGALARYAAAMGCLMLFHATAVGLLTDQLGWSILVAKLLADVTLMAGGQLLVLRYLVFPRNKVAAAAVGENRTAEIV